MTNQQIADKVQYRSQLYELLVKAHKQNGVIISKDIPSMTYVVAHLLKHQLMEITYTTDKKYMFVLMQKGHGIADIVAAKYVFDKKKFMESLIYNISQTENGIIEIKFNGKIGKEVIKGYYQYDTYFRGAQTDWYYGAEPYVQFNGGTRAGIRDTLKPMLIAKFRPMTMYHPYTLKCYVESRPALLKLLLTEEGDSTKEIRKCIARYDKLVEAKETANANI